MPTEAEEYIYIVYIYIYQYQYIDNYKLVWDGRCHVLGYLLGYLPRTSFFFSFQEALHIFFVPLPGGYVRAVAGVYEKTNACCVLLSSQLATLRGI